MNMKRKTAKLLSLVLALCLCVALLPAAALGAGEMTGKTVVVYTGNLRGNVDALAQVAAVKSAYKAKGADVILADTGNFLQGTVYTTYDSGKSFIGLMDKAGYDVAAIGSHEFDFGTGTVGVKEHEVFYADGTLGQFLQSAANLKATSANVFTAESGVRAFNTNVTLTTASGLKVGLFGLTDVNTKNQVLESNLTGMSITDAAQAAAGQVTALKGCDVIIGLSNAGVSTVSGATMIDVKSDAGFTVGALVIDNGTKAVTKETVTLKNTDAVVKTAVDAFKAAVDKEYPASGVAKSTVTLKGAQSAVRGGETNLGDLWTDALLWFAKEGGISKYYGEDDIKAGNTGISVDADHVVALWNGGNLRDYLNTGDVTMKDLKRVLPYPNKVAVAYLTGAKLLEFLEATSQALPYSGKTDAACASFMQAAGISYTVATNLRYSAGDAYGKNWYKASAVNRVTINSVNGKAFDKNATYAVITSNANYNGMDASYVMKESKDADKSAITTASVYDVVWMYINQKLGGTIGSRYAAAQNRIKIDTATEKTYSDVPSGAWYSAAAYYAYKNGLMDGTSATAFSPDTNMTRAMFATMLYRLAGSPSVEITNKFTDVKTGDWYAKAVSWAVSKNITKGQTDTTFAPDKNMSRQEMAVFIYAYFGAPAVTGTSGFKDGSSIASWAANAVIYCTSKGYMAGMTGNLFNPMDTANRAMGATVITSMSKTA